MENTEMLEKIKKAFGDDFEKYKGVIHLGNYGEVHLFDWGLGHELCQERYMVSVGYDYYVHKDLADEYHNKHYKFD